MSHEMIPPGVGEHDAALLRRAYALQSQAEGETLYREWAATYDQTMINGLGYESPVRLATAFSAHVEWRDRPLIDLGCGTGLVARALAEHGFTAVDGLDLSPEMLGVAAATGHYHQLVVADLNAPLPFADGAYHAVLCNGTFTSGHVDAGCLDEIVRILAPGGSLAAAVHHSVWEEHGFHIGFERLVGAGQLQWVEQVEATYYSSSTTTDGRLCVLSRPNP
jgi:predicted TPR repeat methyltransferase